MGSVDVAVRQDAASRIANRIDPGMPHALRSEHGKGQSMRHEWQAGQCRYEWPQPVVVLLVCCWVVIFGGLVGGCAFVRGEVGEPFSEERLQTLEKGKTRRQDVAQQFGAPDEIVHANGRDIFHYRRFDSKLGWLVFFSRVNIGSDHLWIFFDHQGVVEDVVFGNRTKDMEFQIWPFGD